MGLLLIVALELLGLVVAAGLALPWAVEKSIGLGECISVERVVPSRRFTIAAGAAGKRRGQGKRVLTEDSSIGILCGHHAHLAIKAVGVITLELSPIVPVAFSDQTKRTLATCHPSQGKSWRYVLASPPRASTRTKHLREHREKRFANPRR